MIKNPKKNYSLKGKSLSTKIAFVVICAFIFSLFVGSFGGLLYIGRSCSNISTVSAEGLDGSGSSSTTTIDTYTTLNLSSVHYEVYGPVDADGEPVNQEDYLEFMFFLPLSVRSATVGSVSSCYLDYQYWDLGDDSVVTEYLDIRSLGPGDTLEFNLGVMDIHYTENLNVGMRIVADTVLVDEFSTLSTVEFSFRGNDLTARGLSLTLFDINGRSRHYIIAPMYSPGSRGYFLNSRTGYSASFVYSLATFTFDSVSNAYNQGYQAAIRDTDSLFDEYYDDGYNAGLARGKILGAAEAGNYTFASLLDAVFYAPTKMFVSLFNFDFLGVNVLSFVSTLITIIVAFGVIKFFL